MKVILASRADKPECGEELIAGSLTQRQAEVMVVWLNEDRGLPPDRRYEMASESHKPKEIPE